MMISLCLLLGICTRFFPLIVQDQWSIYRFFLKALHVPVNWSMSKYSQAYEKQNLWRCEEKRERVTTKNHHTKKCKKSKPFFRLWCKIFFGYVSFSLSSVARVKKNYKKCVTLLCDSNHYLKSAKESSVFGWLLNYTQKNLLTSEKSILGVCPAA